MISTTRIERRTFQRVQRRRRLAWLTGRFATWAGNFIFCCLILVMGAIVFFLVHSRLAGGPPAVAGHRLYAVLSGSMSPAFDVGSVVAVKAVNPEEVKEGDIITFGRSDGRIVTHRVIGIETAGGLHFVTKGDANNVADSSLVPAEGVMGVVTLSIPWLGRVLVFSQTKQGLLLLIIIPALIILILEGRSLWQYAVKLDKLKDQKSLEALSDTGR